MKKNLRKKQTAIEIGRGEARNWNALLRTGVQWVTGQLNNRHLNKWREL